VVPSLNQYRPGDERIWDDGIGFRFADHPQPPGGGFDIEREATHGETQYKIHPGSGFTLADARRTVTDAYKKFNLWGAAGALTWPDPAEHNPRQRSHTSEDYAAIMRKGYARRYLWPYNKLAVGAMRRVAHSEFEAAIIEYDQVTRKLETATGIEHEKLEIIKRDLESFINRRQNPMSPASSWWGWYDPRKGKFVYPRPGESTHEKIAERLFPVEYKEDEEGNVCRQYPLGSAVEAGLVRFAVEESRGTFHLMVDVHDIRRSRDAIDRVLEEARKHSKLFRRVYLSDDTGALEESPTIDEARRKLWAHNPMSPHSQWWGWYDPGKDRFIYPRSGEEIHTDIAMRLFPEKEGRDDAFEAASGQGMVRFALDLTVDGITPSASDKYGVPYLLVEAHDIRHNADAIDRVLEEARKHSKLFNQIVVADGRGTIQNSKTIDEARRKLWEHKGNPAAKVPARSTWDVGRAQYEAYKAGVRAGDTGLFQDWIRKTGQAHRSPTLLAYLRHEFNRGVMGEPALVTAYKGHTITRQPGGDFTVDLDPESRIDTLRDAEDFIDAVVAGRNPVPFRIPMVSGVVTPRGKVIEFDSREKTHEQVAIESGYQDILSMILAGGVRYIRKGGPEAALHLEISRKPGSVKSGLRLAETYPSQLYYMDVWSSRARFPETYSFSSLVELDKFLRRVA
jgi:hypothetical protein